MNILKRLLIFRFSAELRFLSSNSKSELETLIMEMKKDSKPVWPKQKSKYAAARVTLQVIGSGARGSPSSLYVFSDQSRYLFNCGEGTQRLAHEHKTKLSKLEHVFITHSSWKNFGGLPGMCLTLQDSGVNQVVLHGPPQVDNIFWATKRFIVLRELIVHKADQVKPFEDSVMRVEYVILQSNETDKVVKEPKIEEEEKIDSSSILYGKRDMQDPSEEEQANKKFCVSPRGKDSVGYVCRLHPKAGTLRLDQCEAQGVPLGPLLGQLKAGNNVTLPCGRVVKSSDVTTPGEPGQIFIVLECPDASYLPSLLNNSKLALHQVQNAKCEADIAAAVIHFSPVEVVRLPEYQEWMDKFAPSTLHLTLNDGSTCQGSLAVHRLQYKLNLLHPIIFPLLPVPLQVPSDNASFANQAATLDKYHLRPRKGLDKSEGIVLHPEEYIGECMVEEGFPEELSKLKEALNNTPASENVYPRLSFLGTGSCIPNKSRNTSGILLEVIADQLILLDCGEGTLGQLIRLLGPEESDNALCSLKAIFISHLHADHHIGLVGILNARKKVLQNRNLQVEPLLLLAPHQIKPWLDIYNRIYERISDQYSIVPLVDLNGEEKCVTVEDSLGFQSMRAVRVPHCPNAFGIAAKHKSGWKLVYSGDTEPCDDLIEIGQGCDLLIHEATMEDGLEEEARKKKHSTTSEAIEVGQKMNAKFTLLTHFSQRYSKIPLFNDKFSSTVGIAFDNMRVSLSQLPLIPLLYPALRAMFNKYYEEMEQKTRNHQLRQERKARAEMKL